MLAEFGALKTRTYEFCTVHVVRLRIKYINSNSADRLIAIALTD